MKWLLAFLFSYPAFLFAQKSFTLDIKPVPPAASGTSQPNEILSKIPNKKAFSSKGDRDKEIQNILFALFDNAYLTASADSSHSDSLNETVYIRTGEQFKWATLRKGNVGEGILSAV